MAMTSTASNTVIDLSGDNDNTGALAALSNLPRLNSSACEASFERSCDNPECSAPKLISHIPKRETSEFITAPMVLNQPTLISGFTTVFQIDGVPTRIDNQMNESTTGDGTGVNANPPNTVFRVVPNTHAHIVNYVVVDGAGDTMRKIKENDAETMRKLLFSQRLSAEQMLKKLIAKALETPTRRANVPVPAPISGQTSVPAPAPIPVPASVKVPAPDPAPASAPVLLPMKPVNKPAPNTVPVSTPARLPVKPANKQTPKVIPRPVSQPVSKPILRPVYKTVSKVAASKEVLSIVPPGITVKVVAPDSKQTAAKPSPTAAINPPINKPIQKTYPALTPKPNAASQLNPKIPDAESYTNLATKPVVWQAVPAGAATKATPTPINASLPKATSSTSSGTVQHAVVSTAKLASPSVASSLSKQTTPKLPETDTEPFDVENSIAAASIPTRRSEIASPGAVVSTQEQVRALKRKLDSVPPVQEAIKRLRPRSPTRKQTNSPLNSPPSTKKLPTLKNKLPIRPVGPQTPKVPEVQPAPVEEMLIDAKDEVDTNEEDEIITPDTVPLSTISSNRKNTYPTKEANEQIQPEEPVRRKTKPLMGPASKMKALKDMADAKAMAMTPKKSALISESRPIKIGETTITRTGSSKVKENPLSLTPSQPVPGSLTRPCSVAVTDIAKISTTTDSDSDSKSTRSSPRTTRRSTSDKEPYAKAKQVETLMAKLRTRWALGKEDESSNAGKSDSPKMGRSTRSSAQTTESNKSECDEVSDPTLLTTPSAPSKVMRVVLPPPTNKNDSPHPNLKISSIVSGDTAIAATLGEADRETRTATPDNKSSGGDIEKLQRELEDLRRTVDRLTHGKTT